MNEPQARTGRGTRPLSRMVKAAVTLEILLSIGALGGGLVLVIAPRGEIMPLPLSALAGSPFESYLVPGLILFGVLGLGPLVAVGLAWLRHPLAPTAALVVGTGLLIWVAVEVAIIGYSNEPPLQAIYGILGVAITLVAIRWLSTPQPGSQAAVGPRSRSPGRLLAGSPLHRVATVRSRSSSTRQPDN
jgi:hypothetical protein